MSAERDELKRLVEELPNDRVITVLAEARRRHQPEPAAEWSPAWFASFSSGRTDLGRNHEDLLAEGFGRRHFHAVRPRHTDAVTLLP